TQFEQHFYRFIFEELSELSIQAAKHDMDRALGTLRSWIHEAQQDDQLKLKRASELRKTAAQLTQDMESFELAGVFSEIKQEIHELLFYVKQRLTFRFGE